MITKIFLKSINRYFQEFINIFYHFITNSCNLTSIRQYASVTCVWLISKQARVYKKKPFKPDVCLQVYMSEIKSTIHGLFFLCNIKVDGEEKKLMIDDGWVWILRKYMRIYTRLVTIKTYTYNYIERKRIVCVCVYTIEEAKKKNDEERERWFLWSDMTK